MLIKSVVIGVGGTLAYYGLIYLATLGMPGADWTAHETRYRVLEFVGEAMFVPLIPGALPGFFVATVLARFGIIGGGFHDGGWFLASAISAPLVHTFLVNRWLRRRNRPGVSVQTQR